jgi:hypothetical protein
MSKRGGGGEVPTSPPKGKRAHEWQAQGRRIAPQIYLRFTHLLVWALWVPGSNQRDYAHMKFTGSFLLSSSQKSDK